MEMNKVQEMIARRAARELKGPLTVNLGIGVPTLIPAFLEDEDVYLHTENGMLMVGPYNESKVDPNLVNAGKAPMTELPGASYFDSAASFAMIRGGHIDVSVLGVLQVDETGRIANWSVPGKDIIGIGGAMDLLSGSQKVICTMTHTTKTGEPKILRECTYPLTSQRRVNMIITELCVFVFDEGKMFLTELMPNVTLEEVAAKTEARYIVRLNHKK